jgi:formate-dependent nitrite reductase membrane component NrfD
MLYNGFELSTIARYNPVMRWFWLPGAGMGLSLPALFFGENEKQPGNEVRELPRRAGRLFHGLSQ